jgi:hypothetical protein
MPPEAGGASAAVSVAADAHLVRAAYEMLAAAGISGMGPAGLHPAQRFLLPDRHQPAVLRVDALAKLPRAALISPRFGTPSSSTGPYHRATTRPTAPESASAGWNA